MAQEHPNRLAEWLTLARKNAPLAREHFQDWIDAVREEPRLAWETPAVRYSVYTVGGLVAIWILTTTVSWMAPPPPPSARAAATTADFQVVCSNRGCGNHFVMNRPFGFNDFPVICPRCQQQTGASARLCNSSTCNGRWVAPVRRDDGLYCPICAARFP